MKQKLLRTKIFGVAVLALIVALSWLFLLGPATSKPSRIAEETAAADAERVATLNRIGDIREQVTTLPETQARIDAINTRFPSTVDPALIEERVFAAAAASGLPPGAIIGITPGEATPYTDPSDTSAAAPPPDAGGTPSDSPTPAQSSPPPGDNNTVLQQQVGIQVGGALNQIGAFADTLEAQFGFSMRSISASPDPKAEGRYVGTLSTVVFLLPPMPAPPGQDVIDALNAQPQQGAAQ